MVANFKHGASAYAHGKCRCSVCRAEATAARQRQRAKRAKVHTVSESIRPAPKPAEAAPNVVALPTSSQRVEAIGINEQSVRAECEQSKDADTRQSVVSQAISLARILDNDDLMSMWPTTSRQLQGLMKELQSPRKKLKASHLGTISQMSGRRQAL